MLSCKGYPLYATIITFIVENQHNRFLFPLFDYDIFTPMLNFNFLISLKLNEALLLTQDYIQNQIYY